VYVDPLDAIALPILLIANFRTEQPAALNPAARVTTQHNKTWTCCLTFDLPQIGVARVMANVDPNWLKRKLIDDQWLTDPKTL
jgi:hypothetical protein